MMPEDGLERLGQHDSIFLGAVGYPGVPDHVSLWGLLIPIRRSFEQYINLRPVKLFEGLRSPLAGVGPQDIDLVVVRENNEGEYSEIGGRLYRNSPHEIAVQESVFTRRGVRRTIEFAFALAKGRRGSVTSATKSNGIIHTMPFWDEIFDEVASENPDIEAGQYHIDALAAAFVLKPASLDVVVALQPLRRHPERPGRGGRRQHWDSPSANLNPEGEYPSMFEPVHGSAPDIAGQGIANPIGQIWSGAMMLDHLGHEDAGAGVVSAIEQVLGETEVRTPDLNGSANTSEVTDAILGALEKMRSEDARK